jgi:hypothetical protein
MTALMFFRGDRRTAHVEEPAWANLLRRHRLNMCGPAGCAPRGHGAGIGAPLALKAVAHAEHENLLPDSRCLNVA